MGYQVVSWHPRETGTRAQAERDGTGPAFAGRERGARASSGCGPAGTDAPQRRADTFDAAPETGFRHGFALERPGTRPRTELGAGSEPRGRTRCPRSALCGGKKLLSHGPRFSRTGLFCGGASGCTAMEERARCPSGKPAQKSRHQMSRCSVSTRSQSRSTWGLFKGMPAEVFDMVLEHLSVKEMSVFSMVSKAISSHIAGYVSTKAWRRRMILQKFHHPVHKECVLEHYRSLGLLFKRCTLLLPTKERLKFIYSKLSEVPCFEINKCTVTPGCLGFASYGVFLQTLIAGWDELECHRVFSFLCNYTSLPRKLRAAVMGLPGAAPDLEVQIRLFCRSVLLDWWRDQADRLFWLTRLLQPWPFVSQARLLFIFYGPLSQDGKIEWEKMTENVVPECDLWDLAKIIRMLFSESEAKEWTADSVISILDEISASPQFWLRENLARLLILCGNRVCFNFMASKALNGRVMEISRLLVFLILVCEKDNYYMNWSVKMALQIGRLFPERRSFIQNIETAFSQVAMEMCETLMAGGQNADPNLIHNLCSILNANAHFHTEMLCMFIKEV
nr:PREDICTED: F-box only protein 47 isoform X2 [Lepisosteus oculatus]